MNTTLILCFFASLVASLIITPILIPVLRRLKFGQTIREEGPKWHSKKSGTPTMGGVAFIVSAAAVSLFFCKDSGVRLGIIFSVLYGIIGFADDFIKVVLKRNLGLTAKQKLVLQVLVSVVFLVISKNAGYISTSLEIPFTPWSLELSWLYVVFAAVLMVGFTNAVNLTDGLDGLATSVSVIVCLFFAVCGILEGNENFAVFAVCLVGALLGFLVYNYHPAKVFMGDTGSLFIGGAVSIFSILSGHELLLIVAGIIYFIEALSVMIQVAYFKKTGKRVFLMSPIHHHFEMKGMKETKIVYMFTLVTILACGVAVIAVI